MVPTPAATAFASLMADGPESPWRSESTGALDTTTKEPPNAATTTPTSVAGSAVDAT